MTEMAQAGKCLTTLAAPKYQSSCPSATKHGEAEGTGLQETSGHLLLRKGNHPQRYKGKVCYEETAKRVVDFPLAPLA